MRLTGDAGRFCSRKIRLSSQNTQRSGHAAYSGDRPAIYGAAFRPWVSETASLRPWVPLRQERIL